MSYITDLKVSLNAEQELKYRNDGYFSVPGDLNKGAGGPKIYLWYQRSNNKNAAITRIQFSFNQEMSDSLQTANYKEINKNLNEGIPGDKICLWYFKGSTQFDVPIIDLHVTTHADEEPEMSVMGWKRLACDLNRNNAGGNRIHLWVMQEERTYICDITATINCSGDKENFSNGYIRVDEDTNRDADGPRTFIFYRLTKSLSEAIRYVNISTFEVPGYKKVEQDLNQVPGGPPVFLWYNTKIDKPPIQDLTLILKPEVSVYKKAKIPVSDQDINPQGVSQYLSYYQ